MVRHDPPSRPQDGLLSVADSVAGETAQMPADMMEAQLDRSRRLNEYYNQVVAELRASLAEIGEDEGQPS
jgi:hypothetical protein